MVDRADEVLVEHAGQHARHGGPVLEHVGHAARVAEVVLEHPVGALRVAHDVDPGHQAAGPVGHGDAEGLALEAVAAGEQPARDDAVVHHGLVTDVEIVEEAVEGRHPLDQALLEVGPLVGRDDPGHEVHREGALHALALAVDGEGDPSLTEGGITDPLALGQLVRREAGQASDEGFVVRTGDAVGADGLVEERSWVVPVEQTRRHGGEPTAVALRASDEDLTRIWPTSRR